MIGADNDVIAGHARPLAARQLGLREVPVIVLEHLSEGQRRALVIADNQLALNAGWDEEMLCVGSEPDPIGGENLDDTVTGHGALKLVELMKRPILSHNECGDSVYGPLLGPGTTLMAAKLSGGSCLNVDSAPRYADATVRRGKYLASRTATLDGDGRSFTEMARLLHLALGRQGGAQ